MGNSGFAVHQFTDANANVVVVSDVLYSSLKLFYLTDWSDWEERVCFPPSQTRNPPNDQESTGQVIRRLECI